MQYNEFLANQDIQKAAFVLVGCDCHECGCAECYPETCGFCERTDCERCAYEIKMRYVEYHGFGC